MAIIKTYIGNDPNYKGMKCQVVSKQSSNVEVIFSNEILGKVVAKVKESELI